MHTIHKNDMKKLLNEKLGYEFMGNLSHGQFAEVVLIETQTGEIKAGKLVPGSRIKQRELDVWPLLDHQNLVLLEKTIIMPGTPSYCFVMPRHYMSLEKIVKTEWFLEDKHEMSLFITKRWIMDILSGLEHLHRHNLCHLNIDASNILVDYDNTAKLSGFSLITSSTEFVRGCGIDFSYRPPELAYSRGKDVLVDPVGVDLWSLGVLMLRLFTENTKENVELGHNLTLWSRGVYKKLFQQIKQLEWYMDQSFPNMVVNSLELKHLKNFVGMFLALDTRERPSAQLAKTHIFLNTGLFKPKLDPVWKKKAPSLYIERAVEGLNTLQNVIKRCEEKGTSRKKNTRAAPLRPHKKHQTINICDANKGYNSSKEIFAGYETPKKQANMMESGSEKNTGAAEEKRKASVFSRTKNWFLNKFRSFRKQ